MSLGLGIQEVCKRGSKKAGVARTEERGGSGRRRGGQRGDGAAGGTERGGQCGLRRSHGFLGLDAQ